MSKVLVRKAVEPVITYGADGPSMSFQQTLNSGQKKIMPDVAPEGQRLSGADLSTRRIEGAKAAQNLEVMRKPAEIENPGLRALNQVARARAKAAVERAQPRSFDELYAGQAADRFYDRQVGVGSRGKLTDKDLERGIDRGEGARSIGVLGRRLGRGLAGALGGLSFLTGLESAGAAGAGLEQGLGGAALRSRATYAQTSPGLANIGGEAGARVGAGGVGVKHRLQDRAEARAARTPPPPPVAVSEPTGPPSFRPRSPPRHAPLTDTEREGLEGEQSRLQSALNYNLPGSLPGYENRLVGIDRRLNPSTSGLPFDMRGGAYNPDVFEPVPQFDPASQAPGAPAGQTQLPGAPVAVTQTASPTTVSPTPTVPTTAQGMMTGFFGEEKEEGKIADPTGGVKSAEEAAALAAQFSGQPQSMASQSLGGEFPTHTTPDGKEVPGTIRRE